MCTEFCALSYIKFAENINLKAILVLTIIQIIMAIFKV